MAGPDRQRGAGTYCEAMTQPSDSSLPATSDEPAARPLLFVHIPKTAGTSLLTTLGNAVGESRLLRLAGAGLHQENIDALLASRRIDEARCIAGHFPICAFASHLSKFRVFTVLRDPISRVVSLYRFLRKQDEAELGRLGLAAGFSFDDMVESRSPEIFGQIRSGMCRMLSGQPDLSDSASGAFWRDRMPSGAIERALALLQDIDFGVAERMSETLSMLAAMLDLPFPPVMSRENISEEVGPERASRSLLKAVELNADDIVLYRKACELFVERIAADGAMPAGTGRGGIRHIPPNRDMALNDLAGRQGFHAFEDGPKFAWVIGTSTARLGFSTDLPSALMELRLYRITETYPVHEIEVRINGSRLEHRWAPDGPHWGTLETDCFRTSATNVVSLTVPYTIPARFLEPESDDQRQLSVAVSMLTLRGP